MQITIGNEQSVEMNNVRVATTEHGHKGQISFHLHTDLARTTPSPSDDKIESIWMNAEFGHRP